MQKTQKSLFPFTVAIITVTVTVTPNMHKTVIMVKINMKSFNIFCCKRIVTSNTSSGKRFLLNKLIYLKVDKCFATNNKLCWEKRSSSLCAITNNKGFLIFFLFQTLILESNKSMINFQTIISNVQKAIIRVHFF